MPPCLTELQSPVLHWVMRADQHAYTCHLGNRETWACSYGSGGQLQDGTHKPLSRCPRNSNSIFTLTLTEAGSGLPWIVMSSYINPLLCSCENPAAPSLGWRCKAKSPWIFDCILAHVAIRALPGSILSQASALYSTHNKSQLIGTPVIKCFTDPCNIRKLWNRHGCFQYDLIGIWLPFWLSSCSHSSGPSRKYNPFTFRLPWYAKYLLKDKNLERRTWNAGAKWSNWSYPCWSLTVIQQEKRWSSYASCFGKFPTLNWK